MSDKEELRWAEVERRLKPILGPRSEEIVKKIGERRGSLVIWSTGRGELLFLPPPSPILLPLSNYREVLRPGGFTPPPVEGIYRIEGGGTNAEEDPEVSVKPGRYLKGSLHWNGKRHISYLFLRPEENLIPLLLSSSEPPIPTSLYCRVEEATYFRRGVRAYLLQVVFDLGGDSTPMFTILLKSMGRTIEEVMSGGGEDVLYSFIKRDLNELLEKSLRLLEMQFKRSPSRTKSSPGRLAERLLSLKSEREVSPQDVGRWVGALTNLKTEVIRSLLNFPLSEEVKNLILYVQKVYSSSRALRRSVEVLKELRGTPQYLLLTDLKLENLKEVNGKTRYAHDPLFPTLNTPFLEHSPPPAHLSPLLNSISRTALVSLKRETSRHLTGEQERVMALQRARFVISTVPKRPWELKDVDSSSPLYLLKFSSAYGYTAESMLGYVEKFLLKWLEEFYCRRGINLTRDVLLSSLYFFSMLRGFAEIKGRVEEGNLPVNYLLNMLLILTRNLNKYGAIYARRGQTNAS